MRGIIIGGGIGGVAGAIALRKAGIDVVVLEQNPEVSQPGLGLHLGINTMRALDELGVGDRVRAMSIPVERLQFMSWRGRMLVDWPVGDLGRRLGANDVGVRRPDLHNVLVETLGPDALRTGTMCTGFTQDATGVTALIADGREERGDFLVGADGLRSVIRTALLGAAEPRHADNTSFRAILEFGEEQAPRGIFRTVWGPGAVFVFYRIGRGELYWAATQNPDGDGGLGDGRDAKTALLERYRGFCEPVQAMIEAADAQAIVQTPRVDRDPIKRWGEGRVTLLGDAAHAMLPTGSQGAGQAIEDAVVLGKSFDRDRDVVAALQGYEERRTGRTARFVKQARAIDKLGRWQNPVALAVRERIILRAMGKVAFKKLAKDAAYEF